jgi:tricarballylate dehydrogenase
VAAFQADLERVSDGRCDPDLVRTVAEGSMPTMEWMRSHGVGFEANTERQSAVVDGRRRFWGGLAVRVVGEGSALVIDLRAAAEGAGAAVHHSRPVTGLVCRNGAVEGVETPTGTLAAGAVVLACGGFEADPDWRAAELGPTWRSAKVRGTRFNDGAGLRMALAAGAGRRLGGLPRRGLGRQRPRRRRSGRAPRVQQEQLPAGHHGEPGRGALPRRGG